MTGLKEHTVVSNFFVVFIFGYIYEQKTFDETFPTYQRSFALTSDFINAVRQKSDSLYRDEAGRGKDFSSAWQVYGRVKEAKKADGQARDGQERSS